MKKPSPPSLSTQHSALGTSSQHSALTTSLWSLQHRLAPYLFVLPFVLLFLAFMLYPMAQSVVLSARQYAGPRLSRPVGWGNFRFIVTDLVFWRAVLNTVLFAVLFLVLEIPLSLGLAMLLNSPRVRGRNLLRFAFFSPYLVGSVFASVLFMMLLAPKWGLVNRAVGAVLPWVGSDINWRGDALLSVPAVVIAALWLATGQAMIYFLAALQSVDRELYEAAEVDGAGRWARFRHVTLPGIRPVLTYLLLVGTIYSLQLFELPYLFFQGFGPKLGGLTVVGYLFMNGFIGRDIGYASAVGWVLVLLISIVAWAQLRDAVAGSTVGANRGELRVPPYAAQQDTDSAAGLPTSVTLHPRAVFATTVPPLPIPHRAAPDNVVGPAFLRPRSGTQEETTVRGKVLSPNEEPPPRRRGAAKASAPVVKASANTASRRKLYVLLSLVTVMSLTGMLLLVMKSEPVVPDTSFSLMASDSAEGVFRTKVPVRAGRWRSVLIHHSRTASGDATSLADAAGGPVGLADHFVIGNGEGCGDGEVQIGQRWNDQQPAGRPPGLDHVDPACISICLIGDFDRNAPTPAQLSRLRQIVAALQGRLRIGAEQVWLPDVPGSPAGAGRYFPYAPFRQQLARPAPGREP